MSDAYTRVKAGRLTFKGGESVDKKKKKRKHKKANPDSEVSADAADVVVVEGDEAEAAAAAAAGEGEGDDVYTIDAAKKMKYEELFPVESKKFGYDPANKSRAGARTVEQALDDRVRKKADRYCK